MIYNRFPLIKEFISRDDLFVVLHALVFSVPCLPYDFFRRYFVNKTSTFFFCFATLRNKMVELIRVEFVSYTNILSGIAVGVKIEP